MRGKYGLAMSFFSFFLSICYYIATNRFCEGTYDPWIVFDLISHSHTHVSSYLPLMFHCHGPEPRSPKKTISRQRKINKEMSVLFILQHVHNTQNATKSGTNAVELIHNSG